MSPKTRKNVKKTVRPKKGKNAKKTKSTTKKTTVEKSSIKKTTTVEKTAIKKTKPSRPLKASKVSKLALHKKAAKILKKRPVREPKKKIKSTRGVIYLSHVPHGFYETELKQFFSQFGHVTGVRIPKSTRTGKFKGYAFVEFMFPEVAKIAAETMNNYLMFKKILKAKYLPAEEQKPHVFKYPSFKVPLAVRRKRFLRQQSNKTQTEEESANEKKRLESCVQKKLKKLKKLGINYEFQVANSDKTN